MSLLLCERCTQHYLSSDRVCPNCSGSRGPSSHAITLSILLGLGLQATVTACVGDKYGMADDSWDPTVEDADGDGYDDDDDCDDDDANVHVDAAELELTGECTEDADGDGYGAETPANSAATPGTDCDDTDATIHPTASETAGDYIDSNCDEADDT